MIKANKSESGQAIVLVILIMTGLFALSALAIDGSYAFSDRRQAQNAADAAALAAAMKYAQNPSLTNDDLANIALSKASLNGYNGIAPRSTVHLSIFPKGDTNCPDAPDGYIFQVEINSTLPTSFGTVIGVPEIKNEVTSSALGCAAYYENMYDGNTLAVRDRTACKALTLSGSSTLKLSSSTGQGIYVFSNCDDPSGGVQNALYGAGGTVVSPSVNVVGGAYGVSNFLPTIVNTHVPLIKDNYQWPVINDAICGSTAVENPAGTLNPGVYPGSNPAWAGKTFPPNNITQLAPGMYCLDTDFKSTNSVSLTGTDVTIVQRTGQVSIQGGSINISAVNSSPYKGLLIYVPTSNTTGSVSINGGSSSAYSGSILVPNGNVSINGGGSVSGPFQTQIVADTISIGGSGTLDLSFDSTTQYKPPVSAVMQLLR